MKVRDIMSPQPVCCTPNSELRDVARLMLETDCGEIPVVEGHHTMKPVGVITDRDIVCRAVAAGRNPLELTARDCMTSPGLAVTPETSVDDCCRIMEVNQIRRVLVVDDSGACCGIVSQADVARAASKTTTAKVVKKVSEPASDQSKAPLVAAH